MATADRGEDSQLIARETPRTELPLP